MIAWCQAFDYFSALVVAEHLSSVEGEVMYFFNRWGIDGHKLVYAVIHWNPALDKVCTLVYEGLEMAKSHGERKREREYAILSA